MIKFEEYVNKSIKAYRINNTEEEYNELSALFPGRIFWVKGRNKSDKMKILVIVGRDRHTFKKLAFNGSWLIVEPDNTLRLFSADSFARHFVPVRLQDRLPDAPFDKKKTAIVMAATELYAAYENGDIKVEPLAPYFKRLGEKINAALEDVLNGNESTSSDLLWPDEVLPLLNDQGGTS